MKEGRTRRALEHTGTEMEVEQEHRQAGNKADGAQELGTRHWELKGLRDFRCVNAEHKKQYDREQRKLTT